MEAFFFAISWQIDPQSVSPFEIKSCSGVVSTHCLLLMSRDMKAEQTQIKYVLRSCTFSALAVIQQWSEALEPFCAGGCGGPSVQVCACSN